MAKTDELPGVEGEGVSPKKVKRLDNAIEAWRGIVTERMALTKKEVDARAKVQKIMHEEGITVYPFWVSDEEQKNVVLDSTEKVKLVKPKEQEEESSETDVNDD